MKRSLKRILTTHTGRLERPESITTAMEQHPDGRPADAAFADQLRGAVTDIVQAQKAAGLDVVNDGEFGKLSWNTYLNGRLAGTQMVPLSQFNPDTRASRDRQDFAEFYAELERGGSHYYKHPGHAAPAGKRWACTGPVSYRGHAELKQDLDFLRAATEQSGAEEAFIPSTSPVRPGFNAYYPTDTDYYVAVGEAMRAEYQAIAARAFSCRSTIRICRSCGSGSRPASPSRVSQAGRTLCRAGEPRAAWNSGRPDSLPYLLGKLAWPAHA